MTSSAWTWRGLRFRWRAGSGRRAIRGRRSSWLDAAGAVVGPAAEYLKDVQACGRSDATLRSYGMDLLRWFRFCWAAGLEWDQVTRAEARRFLPVAADRREAGSGQRLRGGDGGSLRDGAAALLRFPPRGRDRPDGQPVPAGPRPGRSSGGAPQSDGAVSRVAGPGCSGPGCRSGPRAVSPMSSSASCSPGSARTGTGRWSRSGSRPGPAPRSCWGRRPPMPIRGGS